MNLHALTSLHAVKWPSIHGAIVPFMDAGGVGSGCQGPNCGRKATGRKIEDQRHKKGPKDPTLQRAAKESYVGTCRNDKLLSEARQEMLAQWFNKAGVKAESLSDQKPFDVLVHGKALLEVKLKLRGKKDEVEHHSDAKARKIRDARQKKLPFFTVAFDERQGESNRTIYFTKGFGYRYNGMTSTTDPKELIAGILKGARR